MIVQETKDLVERKPFFRPVKLSENSPEKLEIGRIVERHPQSRLTMKLVLDRQIVNFKKIRVCEITSPNFGIRLVLDLDDLAKRLRLHAITERAMRQRQSADQIRVG